MSDVNFLICPKCGSSDSVTFYSDTHLFCHKKCGFFVKEGHFESPEDYLNNENIRQRYEEARKHREGDPMALVDGRKETVDMRSPEEDNVDIWSIDEKRKEANEKIKSIVDPMERIIREYKKRGLSEEAMRRYNVQSLVKDNKVQGFVFYYHSSTESDKVLSERYKLFSKEENKKDSYPTVINGKWDNAELFGQHLFKEGGKYLTITEGELDAVATYQMLSDTGFHYPCVVSLNGGAGSVEKCLRNEKIYNFVNSFDNVRVCFDMDDAGQKAAKDFVKKFMPGKCSIISLSENDANEMLVKGKTEDFKKAFWNAKIYMPDDIITGPDAHYARLKSHMNRDIKCYSLPWKTLEDKTYGVRRKETVFITSQAKAGKTTVVGEISHHLLKNYDDLKIGGIYLEGSPEDHSLKLVSIEMNKPLHLPDTEYSQEEFDEAFNNLPMERFALYDKKGFVNADQIMEKVQYFVKGLGCNVIILDNLMTLTLFDTEGERGSLNKLSGQLVQFAETENIIMMPVAHLNRDGNIYGTSVIEKLAYTVIRLERDLDHEDPVVRNRLMIKVPYCRFSGDTGPATQLEYVRSTGRLLEVDEENWVAIGDTKVKEKEEEEDHGPIADRGGTGFGAGEREDKIVTEMQSLMENK